MLIRCDNLACQIACARARSHARTPDRMLARQIACMRGCGLRAGLSAASPRSTLAFKPRSTLAGMRGPEAETTPRLHAVAAAPPSARLRPSGTPASMPLACARGAVTDENGASGAACGRGSQLQAWAQRAAMPHAGCCAGGKRTWTCGARARARLIGSVAPEASPSARGRASSSCCGSGVRGAEAALMPRSRAGRPRAWSPRARGRGRAACRLRCPSPARVGC